MREWKKLLSFASIALLLGACGSTGISNSDSSGGEKATITFVNNKTDWEGNGKWDEYIAEFNEQYPDIEVLIETSTDYAGDIKTRMNSEEYGDVFMLPSTVNPKDYSYFMEPLGDQSEFEDKFFGIGKNSYDNVTYAVPVMMNPYGMIVNNTVFEDAGVAEIPTTPEDFINALKQIKEANPDVTPLNTNYASNWAMGSWDLVGTSVAGNEDFINDISEDPDAFSEGEPLYTIYNILYTTAAEGLIENDPSTTDFEQTKQDMADGKIGVMVFGSWALPQVQEKNPDNADNISFEAFPVTAPDGNQYVNIGPEYGLAVNVHSKEKEAARKFLDWFVNDSNFAEDNGALPTLKDSGSELLKPLEEKGIKIIEQAPAPEGKESLYTDVKNESEAMAEREKQRIIDAAIGNTTEKFEEIMGDLNRRWGEAVEKFSSQ
ncbi:ABC transporter substrate-binding protein [Jeotgalibaca caeni]|uniref:ABC transporter substrate-binding protein n=1 Tax=Jeotgalibaca caeni TaxID=3028623 RepID=UPI00237D4DFB|nr:ABC transporter substrate-binding protein [Jeotgalibaca caeni]MDE1549543.1 ABC transporter substrate-binding protein [Jeotgalibaca caeni]